MSGAFEIKPVAHIRTEFPTKFGLPRQSLLVEGLRAEIVFENEYRSPEALRGLEEYSYIWLIWQFSENMAGGWSPTVRPPRLGGNKRMGVFATRSPFRPNAIGLSCVKLEKIDLHTPAGPIITVSGADLMDNTPIYDIKPYLPHIDAHPGALCGFAGQVKENSLSVNIPDDVLERIPQERRNVLRRLLAEDPRPAYQNNAERVYGFMYAGLEIKFKVSGSELTVVSAEAV